MDNSRLLAVLLLAGAAWAVFLSSSPPADPQPQPPVKPAPRPLIPIPAPKPKPRPWGLSLPAPVGASVGGPVSPDGTEIHCDLPGNLHRKNTASKGLGNCVFTSIHHSGLWQNIPQVIEFPKFLIDSGIPGGGYPSKVDDLIKKISASRNMPVPDYFQVESNDLEVLKLACKSGRMPGVTYAVSPTGRYNGQRIAHMVSLPHADDKWFCVLDNNYPGADKYEWMSPAEFLKTYSGGRTGWAVIFLNPPPPPPPHN